MGVEAVEEDSENEMRNRRNQRRERARQRAELRIQPPEDSAVNNSEMRVEMSQLQPE